MTSVNRRRLESSSWLAVVRAYHACHRRYAALLREFDLTVPQFDALNAIEQLDGEATPMAIADRLVVTRGNVTGVLKRLQAQGRLVTRDNQQDGRSFVCTLTPAADALLARARAAAGAFIEQQLAPFTNDDLQRTQTQMNTMTAHLAKLDPIAIAGAIAGAAEDAPGPSHRPRRSPP